MSRRRLRTLVLSSSDEEDDNRQHSTLHTLENSPPLPLSPPQQQQTAEAQARYQPDDIEAESGMDVQFEAIALTTTPRSANASAPEPILIQDISDEEFIDVSDHLSPPSPPPPSTSASMDGGSTSGAAPRTSSVASECPVSEALRRLGLRLKADWLNSCLRGLGSNVPGFSSFDCETKAKLCFGQFLTSDMNSCGAGVLPENVDSMHLVDLPGPYVLQVDEVVNISSSLKQRYQSANAGPKRCLKLSMTDGVQRVFGMEYRPIKDLEVLAPAGFKVVLKNVTVRQGLLMLVPEVVEVLGGSVEELEAARVRLVAEVNKPPRGKRSKTGVVPPLATRATRAAWPSNTVNESAEASNSPQQVGTSSHQRVQAAAGDSVRGRMGESATYGRESNQLPGNRDATAPPVTRETPDVSNNRASNDESMVLADVPDIQDADMDDPVEHPFLLARNKELPFTYLASLFAKWASMKGKVPCVQGKIKCFLTGVKGFQYKERAQYELQVYVDDGSLISDIHIHHNVVQKFIGYSPQDVTAALGSSNTERSRDMKATLKKFQVFLADFEGILVIEMNATSMLPVAIEMDQGCSIATAWSLLRRVKSLSTGLPRERSLSS